MTKPRNSLPHCDHGVKGDLFCPTDFYKEVAREQRPMSSARMRHKGPSVWLGSEIWVMQISLPEIGRERPRHDKTALWLRLTLRGADCSADRKLHGSMPRLYFFPDKAGVLPVPCQKLYLAPRIAVFEC